MKDRSRGLARHLPNRRLPALRSLVLGLLAAAGACGSGDPSKSLPACEAAIAYVTARTADGRPTIAALELSPPSECRVESPCVPAIEGDAGTGTSCAEVRIRADGAAARCAMTFVSTDGRRVSAAASVHKVEGSDYQCRSGPATYTAFSVAFDPSTLIVDFATASPSDGGVADR